MRNDPARDIWVVLNSLTNLHKFKPCQQVELVEQSDHPAPWWKSGVLHMWKSSSLGWKVRGRIAAMQQEAFFLSMSPRIVLVRSRYYDMQAHAFIYGVFAWHKKHSGWKELNPFDKVVRQLLEQEQLLAKLHHA